MTLFFVQQVKMMDKDTNEEFVFAFDRWMDRDQDDHDIVRELPVVKQGQDPLPGVWPSSPESGLS